MAEKKSNKLKEGLAMLGQKTHTLAQLAVKTVSTPAGGLALRYGALRNIPIIGSNGPIHGFYRSLKETSDGNLTVNINFHENMTLGLTGLIDMWLQIVNEGAYKDIRRSIFLDTLNGLVDENGTVQYERFLKARSKLGPALLDMLNDQVIGNGLPIKGDIDPNSLFEHDGIPKEAQKFQYVKDALLGTAAALALVGVDIGILNIIPPTQQEVLNPDYVEDVLKGGCVGALGFIPSFVMSRAASDSSIRKGVVIGGGLLTTAAGAAVSGLTSKAEKTISFEANPANFLEGGWTSIPLALLGFGLVGLIRIAHHKRYFATITDLIKIIKSDKIKSSGWRNVLTILVDSLHYQQRLRQLLSSKEVLQNTAVRSTFYKSLGITDEVARAVINFKNRSDESIENLRKLTPTRLKDLSAFLMHTEMLGWLYNAKSANSKTSVQHLIPKAFELFSTLDVETLSLVNEGTTGLVKSLKEKDPVAGLSILFPSVSMLALGAGLTPGKEDDGVHFGQRSMNMATSGLFIHPSVRATQDATVAFNNDTLRGAMWTQENIQELGRDYQRSIPIGGLDRINRPSVQVSLLQLYSFAYNLSQETTYESEGSKGLHSDVGETILKSMEQNKLFGYIALADLSNAIKWAPTMLGNLDKLTSSTIINALTQLRHTLVRKIINSNLPTDKTNARRLLTSDEYALRAYESMEMLVESCGDEVVSQILGDRLQQIFAVSGASGDPLIYTEILPVWIFNLRRQLPHSKYLGETVLGQVLPHIKNIAGEYITRISPIGTAAVESKDIETITNYLNLSLLAGAFNKDEKEALADTISKSLDQWITSIDVRFATVLGELKIQASPQNVHDYNRLRILTTLAVELDHDRFKSQVHEIGVKLKKLETRLFSIKA